jgi:hypothetical protein
MNARAVFRSSVSLVVLVSFLSITTACYGPFNLTRLVYKWNGGLKGKNSTETKWIVEGVFLILIILPVYGVAMFLDAVLLNSIQFWTGSNPLKVETEDGATKVVRVGETTASVSFAADGHSAQVAYARDGKVFQTVQIRQDDSTFRMVDPSGRELYSATLDESGRLSIADKDCEPVGNLRAEQLEAAAETMASASAGPSRLTLAAN